MTTRISRRTLLRASGTSALAALLAACADGDAASSAGSDDEVAASTGDGDTADAGQLTVIIPTFEVLVGDAARVPMGILDADQRPILEAAPQVTIERDGEVVAEGLQPTFYGEGLGDRGLYVLEPEVTEAGLYDVVVSIDGEGEGRGVFQAVMPEDAQVAGAPGTEFPTLSTPTTDDPGPLETLCTQEPPCSMHGVSLDDALAAGPAVLTIATPAFCQTAVCGPVVSVVESVRDEVGRDDVTFVHVEVFNDAGETPSPPVQELELPTEPWTWVIGADGVVTDRFDGPVVPSMLADSVRAL